MDKHEKLAFQHQYEAIEKLKKEIQAWKTMYPDQEFNPKTGKIEWRVKQ